MKKNLLVPVLLFCLIAFGTKSYATEPYCQNLGFELGDFTNWTGYTWIYRTDYPAYSTSKVQGIIYGRQTIMTDTTAYDANTGGKLKKIPPGSRYSARLGDAVTGGLEESLSYTITVDSTNALLLWKFAVVLQNPLSGHEKQEEPRFKVTLLDQYGNTIPDCSNYDVYASDASINGFQTYYKSSNNPIMWRDWTSVGANLMPYYGQTITIEFMAADCTHQNHFGYAYFVAECDPLNIKVDFCTGDSVAKLIAPDGFASYRWFNSAGDTIATDQILEVNNPSEGANYSCRMVSATGCSLTLNSTIYRYEPNADFSHDLVDCNKLNNTVQFSNLYGTSNGTLEYDWNFGDGSTSTEKDPTHVFTTSGMHPVTLVVSNPPSVCKDSMTKQVETFYPPLIGISGDSTYCPGSTTTLKGYGAYRYLWSNGSTADSIEVGKDTTVWLIGYSSMGCYTDTIRYKVHQEPDWQLTLDGNSIFCEGDATTLSATGAVSYLWNTGETSSSITTNKSGIYSVTGTNTHGCKKTISINVTQDPLPNSGFSVSALTVDKRHNQLNCSSTNQTGVNYLWNMGDSITETGANISHTYNVSNSVKDYTITLTATNENGCVSSSSKTIDVVPFIPNVFTPNGDGVNEVFVPGLHVQIFDRYGLKLYDGTTGWDGTYNGQKADNDTYFYLINYTDKNNNEQILKGYLTLKR